MLFLAHLILAIASLAAIIYTCSLFTNAIEILGSKLKLGYSAIGSILAVIGTTLPETIVPLVAIFGSYVTKSNPHIGKDIATGAIIGSPFILSTLALFLLGIVLIFQKRTTLEVNYKNVLRNYKYFLTAYLLAIFSSFLPDKKLQLLVVVFLIVFYTAFVYRTINKSKESFQEQKPDELIFLKLFKKDLLFLQIVVSLLGLVLSSHLFIDEIKYFSCFLNIDAVILSLFITPIATELPECINSIIWLKHQKDELAISNVLGAIVFQAIIPVSIGIAFTPWKLNNIILINSAFVAICSILFIIPVLITKKVNLLSLLVCGIFYFSYLTLVLIK